MRGHAAKSTIDVTLRQLGESSRCDSQIRDQAGQQVFDKRVAAGDQAACLTIDDSIVAVLWYALHSYHDIDTKTTIDLPADAAWLYGAWVIRNRRREGLYGSLLSQVSRLDRLADKQHWLFAVDKSNRRSQIAHEKFGTQWVGNISGWKMFGVGSFKTSYHCNLPSIE
jgi:hypothetical protein